jgi:hypothetical protein
MDPLTNKPFSSTSTSSHTDSATRATSTSEKKTTTTAQNVIRRLAAKADSELTDTISKSLLPEEALATEEPSEQQEELELFNGEEEEELRDLTEAEEQWFDDVCQEFSESKEARDEPAENQGDDHPPLKRKTASPNASRTTKGTIQEFSKKIPDQQHAAAKNTLIDENLAQEPVSSPLSIAVSEGSDDRYKDNASPRKKLVNEFAGTENEEFMKRQHKAIYRQEAEQRKKIAELPLQSTHKNLLKCSLFHANAAPFRNAREKLQDQITQNISTCKIRNECYVAARIGLWDAENDDFNFFPNILKKHQVSGMERTRQNPQQLQHPASASKAAPHRSSILNQAMPMPVQADINIDQRYHHAHAERSVIVRTALRAGKIAQNIFDEYQKNPAEKDMYLLLSMTGRYYSCNLCSEAMKNLIDKLQARIRLKITEINSSSRSEHPINTAHTHLIFVYNNIEKPLGDNTQNPDKTKPVPTINDVYFSTSALESLKNF